MQIAFLLMGIIGATMFYFGAKLLIGIYKSKQVATFGLTEIPTEVAFSKPGRYAVCIVGGSYVNNTGNFDLQVSNNGKPSEVVEKRMKFKFRRNGTPATELYYFDVQNTGKYKFEFKNIEDLEVKPSVLLSRRMLQTKLPVDNIGIEVREAVLFPKFIAGLLLAIFGFNTTGWGIILAVNPQLFQQLHY